MMMVQRTLTSGPKLISRLIRTHLPTIRAYSSAVHLNSYMSTDCTRSVVFCAVFFFVCRQIPSHNIYYHHQH